MGWIRHALIVLGVAALLTLTGCGGTAAPQEVAATNEDGADDAAGAPDAGAGADENADRDATLDAAKDTDYPTKTEPACQVLTQDIAKSILGSVGEESASPPVNSNDDVNVTSCVRANAASGSSAPRSVSLLMRVAASVTGAQDNESVFAAGSLPSGAQEVAGYGEAAFWNPAFGQLNILKDGNWYILAAGPIDPEKHTLEQTKTLADAIIDTL